VRSVGKRLESEMGRVCGLRELEAGLAISRNGANSAMYVTTCHSHRSRAATCLFVLLWSFVFPIGSFSEERPLERHLRLAQAHFDAERFQQAIVELRKAIAIDPAIPGTYYQLGYSYWKLGELAEAQGCFEKELQFKPPDPYSHYYLGRILLIQAKTTEAVTHFEKVLSLGPILDIYQQIGIAYLALGRLPSAIEMLEKAVRRNPEQGEAHYKLARAYQRAGRNEEAQHEFNRSRELKWQDQEITQLLLQCEEYLKQKKTNEALATVNELVRLQDAQLLSSVGTLLGKYGLQREALEVLEQAIRLEPSLFEAYYNQGATLVAVKEYSRAEEALRKAIRLRPESHEAQSLLGMALIQQGKDEEALRPLRAAVALKPDNPRLLALLGLKYTEARYYKEAIEILRQAVNLQPSNPEWRFLLIQAYYSNQDFEQALAEARKTLEMFPDLARSHFEVAQQLNNMGSVQQARPLLGKALSLDPQLVEARVSLGEILLKQGLVEDGLKAFREALKQRQGLIEAHVGAGKALLQLNRYEEAASEIEQATRLAPDQPQPHFHLAQAYRALGRHEDAARETKAFSRLNRERMERRDRETERTFVP
jgi:tetratricopeptide (TPR) repeat protein